MCRRSSSSVKVFYPKYDRDKVIKHIKSKIDKLSKELPLRLVALFGSYSKGNYTVASDIDLLIVYDKSNKDAYKIVKKVIDLPMLEPHVYSYDEYDKIKERIDKMIKDGVIIFKDS